MSKEDRERYMQACHAMQSGVKAVDSPNDKSFKHIRVGINSALVSNGAIVKLLIDKGVITLDEFEKYIAVAMEEEVESYKKMFAEKHNIDPSKVFFA